MREWGPIGKGVEDEGNVNLLMREGPVGEVLSEVVGLEATSSVIKVTVGNWSETVEFEDDVDLAYEDLVIELFEGVSVDGELIIQGCGVEQSGLICF